MPQSTVLYPWRKVTFVSSGCARRMTGSIRWTEAGGPPVDRPTRNGFGTHIVEAMTRGHEGGDVRLNWHADGLACEITLPM
jgi:two-component sensor histidine kinase